jgi:hypothetical protein
MAIRTAGTELYAIDPADCSLITVGCPTSIDGIDSTLEQLETTCLSDTTRTYVGGLATPGTASFGINTDPRDPSHVRLHQLKIAGETVKWAVGWSDGTGVPPTAGTDSNGECVFTLPENRSWITFEGFINSFPFNFSLNATVQSTVGIQVSGEPTLIPAGS